MEQINKPISGVFVEVQVADIEDDDSDDEGDDDIPWLGYKEVSQVHSGKSFVTSRRPKQLLGSLIDIVTKKGVNFRGSLHLQLPCWEVIALRTKKAKDKNHYPADVNALSYRLRNDPKRFLDNVVHLLLTKIGKDLSVDKIEESANGSRSRGQNDGEESSQDKVSAFLKGKEMFYNYLSERDQYNDLDIYNLEERVTEFHDGFLEDLQNQTIEDQDQTVNPWNNEQFKIIHHFRLLVLRSFDFRSIKLAQTHPDLVRYLPQLFPNQFLGLIRLKEDQHRKLAETLKESPGHLAFKPILAKDCDVLGFETNTDALERSGLMAKVPQVEREAILMYEYIKDRTKQDGHTCVRFDAIMNYFGSVLSQIEDAHQFLEKNKVTKTRMEGGYRMVYLTSLWKAEKQIAEGIHALIDQQENEPWKLNVDWDTENFRTIRDDADQWRAGQLIASQPVVAISGKGGCGKTHVVTQVITAAKAASSKNTNLGKEKTEAKKEDSACFTCDCEPLDNSDLYDYDEEMKRKSYPESVNLLLTAPTGKAANLLGKRADSPSYTLHQVIFSYRALEPNTEWKHKDVNTLVVDECSLVAVTTFAFLIQLLIENANLRRIVLLGDVRQLPSIEPGNFLDDLFQSLSRLGCGVELRRNHRAESQIVVDNATRISKKIYPEFVEEKFTLLTVPEGNPAETGDDLVNDDTEQEVMKVLNHPSLKDDSKSQFISFTRKICERINEACCRKYSGHSTKTCKNRWDFQVNDKICCTKNAYIRTFDEEHGLMVAKKKSAAPNKSKNDSNVYDEGTSTDAGVRGKHTGLQQGDTDPSIPGSDHKTAEGDKVKKREELDLKRLCNGEIFFIENDKILVNERNQKNEYLFLSERDPDCPDAGFWVDRKELKKACKIRHAWARTIHTFQGSETDHIVYIVGKKNRHQNWQHVYTAITRGRKSVFIIGQDSVLRQVIKTMETKRQTSLRKQLTALLQKNTNFMSSQSILKQSHLNMSPLPTQNNHNSTQMITNILAGLAEEHDGVDTVIEGIDTEDHKPEKGQTLINMIDKNRLENEGLDKTKLLYNENSLKKSKLKLNKNLQTRYKETNVHGLSPVLKSNETAFLPDFNRQNTGSFTPSNTQANAKCDTHNDSKDSYVIENYDSPASITEPRSNESIWSEADESQYVSFVDATMCSLNGNDKGIDSNRNPITRKLDRQKYDFDHNRPANENLETPQFTRLKSGPKTSLFRTSLNSSGVKNFDCKTPDVINDSVSQWSDVPDEHYLSLNLEDLERMESDFDNRNGTESNKIPVNEEQNDIEGVRGGGLNIINDRESFRETRETRHKTPECLVRDTPPTPNVPDTPTDQYSRKRRSSDYYDEDFMSPTKRKDKKDLSLTPIKRSLAELQFD